VLCSYGNSWASRNEATTRSRSVKAHTVSGAEVQTSVTGNYDKIDTYAVIAPGEAVFSLFSLPTPRFARPGVFRRTSKSMRDWENEPESTLTLPVTKGDTSATTAFGFAGRCCSTCGIRAGTVEGAETAGV
jgi:hypothetical protein